MSLCGKLNGFRRQIPQSNNVEPKHCNSMRNPPQAIGTPSLFSRVLRDAPAATPLSSLSPLESAEPKQRSSKLVVAFGNTITASQLSDLLIWSMYYDIVELSRSPTQWYSSIGSMEMQGWVTLSRSFSQDTKHCLDLIVLDLMCDRSNLSKPLIRECLFQLKNSKEMVSTLLSTTIHPLTSADMLEIEILKIIKAKLSEVDRLVRRLSPFQDSKFSEWQPKIVTQIIDFINVVVTCRLAALRKEGSINTDSSHDRGRKWKHMLEVIQEKRQLPLNDYNTIPDSLECSTSSTAFSNADDVHLFLKDDLLDQEEKAERLYTAQQLQAELRTVRALNLQLTRENANYLEINEKLVKKLSSLNPIHPEFVSQVPIVPHIIRAPSTPDGWPTSAPVRQASSRLFRPAVMRRNTTLAEKDKRTLSSPQRPSDSEKPAKLMDPPLTPLPCSGRYDDVFEGISSKPLPLPLIDPRTGDVYPSFPFNFGSRSLTDALTSGSSSHKRLDGNDGVVDLSTTAAVKCSHIPSTTTNESTSRSVSNESKNMKALSTEPGPQNSLAEFGNRQIGKVSPILCHAVPRRTVTLNSARNTVASVVRRKTLVKEFDADQVKREPRRSKSMSNTLNDFMRQRWVSPPEEENTAPDISTNF